MSLVGDKLLALPINKGHDIEGVLNQCWVLVLPLMLKYQCYPTCHSHEGNKNEAGSDVQISDQRQQIWLGSWQGGCGGWWSGCGDSTGGLRS